MISIPLYQDISDKVTDPDLAGQKEMASQLMQKKARLVAYMPSLRAAVKHFRTFSSYDERKLDKNYVLVQPNINDPSTQWPDTRLGPFSPQHRHFPMPGLTGPSARVKAAELPIITVPDIISEPTLEEKRLNVLHQYIETSSELAEEEEANYISNTPASQDYLECIAQDCPQLIKKDFQDLFPDRDLSSCPLTVLTLSQRTKNDMSSWSSEVDLEREELLQQFVSGASEICDALRDSGYWADFIDPSSGRPYLGEYTNATLYETDERYKHFGFEIEDLGCCKVIRHHLWGTRAYVGCLFTNAPLNDPIIQAMSEKKTKQ